MIQKPMTFQANPYFYIQLVNAALAFLVLIFTITRRKAPGAAYMLGMMASITYWAICATLEAAAVEQEAKILFAKLEYWGVHFSAPFFLLFVFNTTRKIAPNGFRRVLLFLIPVIINLLAATNEWHGLIWTGFKPGPAGTNSLIYLHGAGFWVGVIFSYLCYFLGLALLLVYMRAAPQITRKQLRVILIGSFISWMITILYVMNINPLPGLDLTIAGFLVMMITLSLAFTRQKFLKLLPIARELLIDVMQEGVLVLDTHNVLLDANTNAVRMLNLNNPIGKPIQQVYQPLSVMISEAKHVPGMDQNLLPINGRILNVTLTAIHPGEDQEPPFGYLVLLRDITEQKNAETRLQQINKDLKVQLEENKRLQDRLQEQAIRDELTGLYNRRYLEMRLEKDLATMVPLAVIMLDLDHFKEINDRHGHKAGDLVLQSIGNILTHSVRSDDIACRYGGEEFVIVLFNLNPAIAKQRAVSIHQAIGNMRVDYQGEILQVTASVGVALCPEHGNSSESLLAAADAAMYQAKASGRNCVSVLPARLPEDG